MILRQFHTLVMFLSVPLNVTHTQEFELNISEKKSKKTFLWPLRIKWRDDPYMRRMPRKAGAKFSFVS